MIRKVVVFGDHFITFYKLQDRKTQQKIEYVLDMIRFEKFVPRKYLKYIEGSTGIYEVRVVTTFKSIRIFCFFDKGDLVVLTNCFLKKTQRTPRHEILLAESLKADYFVETYGGDL